MYVHLTPAHSDDRSPTAFAERISSATQMQAAVNAAARPNCLIIDEIDGAPAVSGVCVCVCVFVCVCVCACVCVHAWTPLCASLCTHCLLVPLFILPGLN